MKSWLCSRKSMASEVSFGDKTLKDEKDLDNVRLTVWICAVSSGQRATKNNAAKAAGRLCRIDNSSLYATIRISR